MDVEINSHEIISECLKQYGKGKLFFRTDGLEFEERRAESRREYLESHPGTEPETGHKHLAEAQDVRLYLHEGTLYMRAPSGTTVVHEEHHAVEIPPGDYQIGTVREYDHFKEEARRVID